jgi:hypothetical protein
VVFCHKTEQRFRPVVMPTCRIDPENYGDMVRLLKPDGSQSVPAENINKH